MAKVKWKGSALLAPLPVALVTVADGEKQNILTIAWTGIVNSHPPKLYISVRPERYSFEMLQASREFVLHPATKDLLAATDGCGIYSGKKVDKFKKYHLATEPADQVLAPVLSAAPMAFECRVTDVIPLGSHHMFLADILQIDIEESLLDEKGKLHLERANLISFAHGEYCPIGRKLGGFGGSVKKKKSPRKSSKG
ncbi:MAG: flavin reductase family protein [Clostridia bacterium]|nr:flavin reductase family protein [Clostridia bacterium]